MGTTDKPRRMTIREFRAAVKSTLSIPVVVTADGQEVFAVVNPNMLRDLLDRAKAHEVKCPFCGFTAEPKPLPGEAVQAQCPNCRRPFRWIM